MRVVRYLILLLPLAACGGADCVALPCPAPIAVWLTITSTAAGGGVPVATVTVTGPEQLSFSYNGTCPISGSAGTYHLAVAAPGFGPVERSVQVEGTNHKCGCSGPVTETVTIALSAADTDSR
jgi:hypothetical protein